jgi:hypothetical protein
VKTKEPIEITYKTTKPPKITEEPSDVLTYISTQGIKSKPLSTELSYGRIIKMPGREPVVEIYPKITIRKGSPSEKMPELLGKYVTSREIQIAERFDLFVKEKPDFTTKMFVKKYGGTDVLKWYQEQLKLQQTKDLFSYFNRIAEQPTQTIVEGIGAFPEQKPLHPAGSVSVKEIPKEHTPFIPLVFF